MDRGSLIADHGGTPPDGELLEGEHSKGAKHNKPYFKKFIAPDSDDEFTGEIQHLYNVNESWRTLLAMPSCQKVMITEKVQIAMKIQVGVNVTQEFPWKQIQFKDLRDNLFDEVENATELIKLFTGFDPEHYILIGYCPALTEQDEDPPEGDPFIFFIGGREAKMAMGIIENMEAFERWRMRRRLYKKPRRWVSQGTEQEMSIIMEHFKEEPVDVEIQSVYPLQKPKRRHFSFRKVRDVRDGALELVPSESAKFENITRRRITIGIQSAPQLIDREQQTNPTFPANAWSQYLYEIDDADVVLDKSDEEEEAEKKERNATSPPPTEELNLEKPQCEMSEQIHLLLNILDFNQIDGYRNDYELISKSAVTRHTNPYLEEFICFANIAKSSKRFVSSISWYPNVSGLLAASYAFSTPCTTTEVSERIDYVQRAVLEPNPVLLWSFADNLNFKLEFEAHFEVTALSFCPSKGDFLLGGCQNGVIIVWDLQGRIQRLDEEEYLTAEQAKNRQLLESYIDWTLPLEEHIVEPATMTPLDTSPKGAITGIYWLSSHSYINQYGKVYNDRTSRKHYKFFVTCAFDGTISFWNLEGGAKKDKEKSRARNLPKELTQNESVLKNKTLNPIYNLSFNEPITSIIANYAMHGATTPNIKAINANPTNFSLGVHERDSPDLTTSMIVSTFYGRIHRIDWLGIYNDADPTEKVNSSGEFARVHDGPIVAMRKNPFYTELFASIGRTILAVWKDDYSYSAVFWRKRPCDLTALAWSETRPAVLYVTRMDGTLEIWDILARDDEPCLTEILGGGIVTAVTEHKPSLPYKILGIGDYNSSIRMVKLPANFDAPLDNELRKLIDYVTKQIKRKKDLQAWEQNYYEKNKDIIEAKRQAAEEARKEMERLEKEEQLNERKRQAEEAEDQSKSKPVQGNVPYNERMAEQWDKLNLNRMVTILMSRKQMDPEKLARETALEKDRLAYELAKKESNAQVLLNVDNELNNIRSRILPAEVPDMQRNEMIQERVKNELLLAPSYEEVCERCFKAIEEFTEFKDIDYVEFLERGRRRRQLLDQSLGGNTERIALYQEKLKDMTLYDCNFGYDFLYTNVEHKTSTDDTIKSDVLPSEMSFSYNEDPERDSQIDN